MGFEPGLFSGRPLRLARLRRERESVDVVCPPRLQQHDKEVQMRAVALDVHGDFCEVAIGDQDGVRAAGRIKTRPDELELFARVSTSTTTSRSR
jgi:hypothetical protein